MSLEHSSADGDGHRLQTGVKRTECAEDSRQSSDELSRFSTAEAAWHYF